MCCVYWCRRQHAHVQPECVELEAAHAIGLAIAAVNREGAQARCARCCIHPRARLHLQLDNS